jgi:4-oxalocrotonate tautomerase
MGLEKYLLPLRIKIVKRAGILMPIIHVQMMEGRPKEKVAELIRNVTNTVSETLESPKENIRVLVTEIPKTHWGKAGEPVEK